MKKIISILMLVCLLGSFAACGQQEDTAAVIITPEPVSAQVEQTGDQTQVEVPDVAPMEQTAQANTDSAAEDADQASRPDSGSGTTNTNTGTNTTTNTNTGTTTSAGDDNSNVDKASVAQGYIGSSLASLQSVIGTPNSSEYIVSCIEGASQEGLLYYDGFIVWTIQYNDGSEVIMGVS